MEGVTNRDGDVLVLVSDVFLLVLDVFSCPERADSRVRNGRRGFSRPFSGARCSRIIYSSSFFALWSPLQIDRVHFLYAACWINYSCGVVRVPHRIPVAVLRAAEVRCYIFRYVEPQNGQT